MKPVRQTAQQAVKVMRAFCDAHGMDVITAAYGWRQPPESLKKNERFWAYYDIPAVLTGEPSPAFDESLVAWGALFLDTRDADDDEAHVVDGVFPEYQRRGYRLAIHTHLLAQAKKMGADQASLTVKKTNEAHYNRTMREAHSPDSKWIYAGDVWFPAPGHGYFVCPL